MIHYSLIGYMIAAAIIMLICTLAYRLLLENKVQPTANRKILLAIYVAMIFVPLLVSLIPEPSSSTVIEIGTLEFGGVAETNDTNVPVEYSFSLKNIIPWILKIYYAGVFIMFAITALTVGKLMKLMKNSMIADILGKEVYIHNSRELSSFSWLNKIFLYNGSLENTQKDLEILLSHEEAHLNNGHWIDLALAQTVLIFQWFNPAAWYIRNELQRIHEYEADETVISSGVDEKTYQMLLIKNISRNRYSGLTDGLNNCSLKKRIIMMKKKSFKSNWMARGFAVVTFALLGGALIHIPTVAATLSQTESSTSTQVNNSELSESNHQGKVYDSVDESPDYPGGGKQLMKDLSAVLKYPEEAKKEGISGRVVVKFIVSSNGEVTDPVILRPVDKLLDQAALEAVKNLPAKWIPGKVDGKPVATYYVMPVSFKNSPKD